MTTEGKETSDAQTRSRRFLAGSPQSPVQKDLQGDPPGVLGKGEVSAGATELRGTQVVGSGIREQLTQGKGITQNKMAKGLR